MDNDKRTEAWRRNHHLEDLLSTLSELMAPAQALCNERDRTAPKRPIVLVVGAPRSGTTLMMQAIAAGGLCAYPTNVLGRFFAAPGVGARIHRLLFDPAFRFRDEFDDLAPAPPDFSSRLGKTHGALAPNEFWYFWRRFLPTSEIEPIADRMGEVRMDELAAELHSVTAAFERPFAAKGMMLQYDIEAFAEAIPELFFLHVERDPAANARSLLDARMSFFGNHSDWYSAKPHEYPELRGLPPAEQAVGQVEYTNRSIRRATASLPPERTLHVPYEAFCADPASTHRALRAKLFDLCPDLAVTHPSPYDGPRAFTATRSNRDGAGSHDPHMVAIQKALSHFPRQSPS